MERDESVTVDTDDNRVDGHTFEGGYELHDIGEAHVTRHLEHMGFGVETWGINRREDKSVLSDDKMDLKVLHEDELAGLLEIKTKRNDGWFGVVNRHHFREYLLKRHELNVPAVIYMSLADDEEAVLRRDTFIPIQKWDELHAVLNDEYEYYPADEVERFLIEQVDDHPQVERSWRAPDGNQVVTLDINTGLAWPEITAFLRKE